MSGKAKNIVREKWPKTVQSCVFASIDFVEFVHFILVSDHALLHSYPHHDNNTSTGMIFSVGRSAASRQGNTMEFSGNFTLSGEWSH